MRPDGECQTCKCGVAWDYETGRLTNPELEALRALAEVQTEARKHGNHSMLEALQRVADIDRALDAVHAVQTEEEG